MLKYCPILLLLIIFFSCENEKLINENSESNFNLIVKDTLEINSNIAVAAINPEIYRDSLLLMMDGGFQDLFLYNLKTGDQQIWDNDFISGTRLPNVALSDYAIFDDYLYLYYQGVYSIFKFSLSGKFIEKIKLDNPNFGSNPTGGEFFEINSDEILINQEFDGYNSLRSLFKNTDQIGIFDHQGKALKAFGEYDKQYHEGSIVLTKFNNYILNDSLIYTLNSVGPPKLKFINFDGDIVNSFRININDFNEQVYYFESSPTESKINDQITQIGIDVVRKDSLIYFSYQRYDNENPPEGYETLEFKLGILDLSNKALNTFKVGGQNLVGTTKRMIPQIYNGKIYFLLSPNDTEKEQLILVEAEIQ